MAPTSPGQTATPAAPTAEHLALNGNRQDRGGTHAHGASIPNSCRRSIVSVTPIVVSPTTASCRFNYENVDPAMSVHYSSASGAGCVPNCPFRGPSGRRTPGLPRRPWDPMVRLAGAGSPARSDDESPAVWR